MGWNLVKEAEKKAKRAIDKIIKPAVESGKKAVYDGSVWARDAVRKVQREAEDGVRKVGREAEDHAKKTLQEVEDGAISAIREAEEGLTDKLPDLVEDCFDEVVEALTQAVTKEGLTLVRNVVRTTHREMSKLAESKPELVAEIDKLGGHIELGPVTLEYDGFYTRTEELTGVLDSYISSPPEPRRSEIIAMVKALGPTSIDLGISVQVVALVVGSKELGIGGGVNSIGIGLFAEIGDAILEEIGVPE